MNTIQNLGVRILLFAVSFVVCAVAKAEQGVILKLKNGNEVGFVFTSQPKITSGVKLRIRTIDGFSVSYDYAQISSVGFGEIATTKIEEITTSYSNQIVFHVSENQLMVEGLRSGESVSLYNLKGLLLGFVRQTTDSVPLILPLTTTGVFVVHTSTGVSYKFINK